MSYTEWKDKTEGFRTIDVRGIQGNFFQGLKKQAIELPAGEGLEIIQSFDPILSIIPSRLAIQSTMHISTELK